MAYEKLPQRTTNNINAAADVNQLQTNIDAVVGGDEPTTNINTLDTALQEHKAYTLQIVNSEIVARESADNTLQSNIDTEEAARISADNQLQANIDALREEQDSDDTFIIDLITSTGNILQSNIDSEESTRISSDTELYNLITSTGNYLETLNTSTGDFLEALITSTGVILQNNINTEQLERELADAELELLITSTGNILQTNIDTEELERQLGDSELDLLITSTGNVLQNNLDNKTHASLLGLTYTSSGHVGFQRETYESSLTPSVTDDSSSGYKVGEFWYNNSTEKLYFAKNVTEGAADWEVVGSGAGGGGGGSSFDITVTSPHDFVVGDLVRFEDVWVRAKADSFNTIATGLITLVPDNLNFTVASRGLLNVTGWVDETSTGLIENTWYYLSDTTAGAFTAVKPTLGQPIFYTHDNNGGTGVTEAVLNILSFPEYGANKKESFLATQNQNTFTLSFKPINPDYIDIYIDQVYQYGNYTLDGYNITFDFNLNLNQVVDIKYAYVIAGPSGAIIEEETIIATSTGTSTGQTVFTFSTLTEEPLGKDYIILAIDGITQPGWAYTLNGKEITLSEGVPIGTAVYIKVFQNLNLYDVPTTIKVNTIRPKDGTNIVTIDSNLQINGTTTTISAEDLDITDNVITLNKGETGSSVSLGTAGIEIDRGTGTNATFQFNETKGSWDSNNNMSMGSGNAFYFGDPNTDGTWRIIRVGNDLNFQRRESSSWVNKGGITP